MSWTLSHSLLLPHHFALQLALSKTKTTNPIWE